MIALNSSVAIEESGVGLGRDSIYETEAVSLTLTCLSTTLIFEEIITGGDFGSSLKSPKNSCVLFFSSYSLIGVIVPPFTLKLLLFCGS